MSAKKKSCIVGNDPLNDALHQAHFLEAKDRNIVAVLENCEVQAETRASTSTRSTSGRAMRSRR